jgi:hypothetical protein
VFHVGAIFDAARSDMTQLMALQATDQEQTPSQLTFSVTSGALPSGLSLSPDGTWTGTADAVVSDTVSTFNVTVSDGIAETSKAFQIEIKAPIFEQLAGSGTWTAPAAMSLTVLVVGAGGGDSDCGYGGPGAGGGVVVHTAYTVTNGEAISYSVGPTPATGTQGSPSTFRGIIAMGGGAGGSGSGGANGGVICRGGSCGCCRSSDGSRETSTPDGGVAYEGFKAGNRYDNHYLWGSAGAGGAGGDGLGNHECGTGDSGADGGPGVYVAEFSSFGEDGYFGGGTKGSQGRCPCMNAYCCYSISSSHGKGRAYGGGNHAGLIILKY